MPNRLATETSPYLLQHRNNPVDWYPWGPEAIQRAQRENKPIFLSIGYAACHWCHVMEHESFENEQIAKYLNEHFVCIKVDREERPDLDQIYMNAVQIMTGRGGWPMSVFLTPDLKPFYGGTYWPPTSRMGMPGFDQVLAAVVDAWQNRRDMALKQADELTGYLQSIEEVEAEEQSGAWQQKASPAAPPTADHARQLLENARRALIRAFDPHHGGFGTAPKFPHSTDLQLLLRLWKRQPSDELLHVVTLTLDKMAAGGIYDHLAGGFARYSVDQRWLVPHFEKMLYDNALLAGAYLDAYLVTREPRYGHVAREICTYVLRYMTDSEGGFHSSEDADSEGQEGKFYVWTPAEIKAILGEEAGERFCYVYDVSEQGNFEHGKSILHLPKTIEQCAALKGWNLDELKRELAASRARLLAARDRRVRPGKDDKVLVSWNALMIDALARAGVILDAPHYVALAENAAAFILEAMTTRTGWKDGQRAQAASAEGKASRESMESTPGAPDGRLLHTWRHGTAKQDAFLDDYAYLINSLVTLYEASFNEQWIDRAVHLTDLMLRHFEDKERGGFFFTADDSEPLIARNKDLHDASVPSGNAMAATALIRLGKLCGRSDYLEAAGRTLAAGVPVMERTPTGAGQMLIALDLWLGPMKELVLIGGASEEENQRLTAALRRTFLPNAVFAYRSGRSDSGQPRASALESLFHGRHAADGRPTLFVCENFVCQAPLSGHQAISNAIRQLAAADD